MRLTMSCSVNAETLHDCFATKARKRILSLPENKICNRNKILGIFLRVALFPLKISQSFSRIRKDEENGTLRKKEERDLRRGDVIKERRSLKIVEAAAEGSSACLPTQPTMNTRRSLVSQ